MAVAKERQPQEAFYAEVRALFHRIRVIPDEALLRSLPTSQKELAARDKATKKVVLTGEIISKAEVTSVLRHETELMIAITEIIEKHRNAFQMNKLAPSKTKIKLSDAMKKRLTQLAVAIKKDKNYGTIPEKNARAKKIELLKKGLTPGQILTFGNSVRVGVGNARELKTNYDEIVSNTCGLRAARQVMETLRKQKGEFSVKTAYHIYVKAVNMDPRMKTHAKLLNARAQQRLEVLKLQIRKKPIPKKLKLPPRSQMRHK